MTTPQHYHRTVSDCGAFAEGGKKDGKRGAMMARDGNDLLSGVSGMVLQGKAALPDCNNQGRY